ncbi:MAG: hypothetical protein U0L05_05815 [Schaedlerella sp.]|nr:hypothetical protein [Schaedlerella sp.]
MDKQNENTNFPQKGVPQSDEFQAFERKPYHKRHYMLYGNEEQTVPFDMDSSKDFLQGVGIEHNSFRQARDGRKIAEHIEATFKPAKAGSRYCDFCGTEVFGVEYETLADGRDRCMICGRTAIKTEEEFRKIFQDVKRNMESFFGIKFNADVRIEMVNSQTLHKRLGQAFIPTPAADGRVLGVAISDKNGYTLLIENGAPRMSAMLTIAHELTHIWQYLNWDDRQIRKRYGNALRLQIYEGMAKWVEIQYAYLINEPAVAKREEIITSYRQDEYGFGFLRYRANYPFSTGTVITRPTPFMNLEDPLSAQYCGAMKIPGQGEGGGSSGGISGDGYGSNKEKKDKKHRRSILWLIIPLIFLALLLAGVFLPKNESSETNTTQVETEEETEKEKEDKTKKPENEKEEEQEKEQEEKAEEKNIPYYAYEKLTEDEKKVYDAVCEAFTNFESEIPSMPAEMTTEEYFRIEECINMDHPEFFWYRGGSVAYSDQTTGIVKNIEITYCMTKEEAERRQKEIDAVVTPFLETLDENISDYELTKAAYEFIIESIDYDTVTMDAQKKNGALSDKKYTDDIRSIYGVFVNKKAVCAGYAKALQYIFHHFERECSYVWNEDHAWNLLKMENDYYHVDATWGDGSNTHPDFDTTDAVNYGFLGLTTAELQRLEDHTIMIDLEIPECTKTEFNYHVNEGLYIDAYNYDKIKSIIADEVAAGNYSVSIKCANKQVFDECLNTLVMNYQLPQMISEINSSSGKNIDSNYTYYKDERLYTLGFELKNL